MSGLVVDASVVVAWLFDDEDDPRADKVLAQLADNGALVPPAMAPGDPQRLAHG